MPTAGYPDAMRFMFDDYGRLMVSGDAGGVVPVTDPSYVTHVAGIITTMAREFDRPNDSTAYITGDVVSNSTATTTPLEFPSFARVNGGTGYIVKARLSTNKVSITPKFRVHLYSDPAFIVSADNLPMRERFSDRDRRLGYFDLPAMTSAIDTANSDMSRSFDLTLRIAFTCKSNSQSLYAVLETLDGFTPNANQTFALTLVGDLN